MEEDDHGHPPFLRTRRADPLFSRRGWHRTWPPSELSTEERRKVAMVNLPVSLGIGRADLLVLLKICHDHLHSPLLRKESDHGHHPLLLRTRRADSYSREDMQ